MRLINSLVVLWAISSVCEAQPAAPKIIDCHIHHNGSLAFLDQLSAKLKSVDGVAMLITAPKDLGQVSAFMRQHPGPLIGLGEIQLDAPDVLATINRFQQAGFRGLGEITRPQYPYDDRRYWPIYERAEKYRMIILFHTGIVNRTNPAVASDVSSDRMRPSTLDLIGRRFPQLIIIGAHLGNPDYAWAGEVARWNPNIYFDVSGSTLIKKQKDYAFFESIFWWSGAVSAHTPQSAASAFQKLVFGSDVFDGDLDEFDRALERYRDMLSACQVSQESQARIFSDTLWNILNRGTARAKQ